MHCERPHTSQCKDHSADEMKEKRLTPDAKSQVLRKTGVTQKSLSNQTAREVIAQILQFKSNKPEEQTSVLVITDSDNLAKSVAKSVIKKTH